MNIWCISKYSALPNYGAGARLFYLAKEFNRNGNNALLITSDSNHLASFPETNKKYNFESVEGLDVLWLKTRKYTKTASISRILSWFDFELGLFRLDRKTLPVPDSIIVSSLSILTILFGWYLKRKYKAKLIFEIRDIWPLTMVEEGGFNRFHPLVLFIGWIEKFGYKKADLISGTMPRLDKHVEETLGYARPFFCSPLGFDPALFAERYAAELGRLDEYFPEDKVIIGYAGSMGISNNLEPFVKCIEKFESEEKIHFVLVGGGDLREQYESRLSGTTNVTFVPRLKSSEVPAFLKRCDILYLSTHDSRVWDFGQSMNKVVEYMYAGKPVIASYSGYRSMLNEANSGIFVPSNDVKKLQESIKCYAEMSEAELEEIGKRGYEWILKHRTFGALGKEYLDAIEAIA